MVKYFKKAQILFLFCVCFFSISCNNDLLGLFVSTGLDERLVERNNLRLLESRGHTTLTLGDTYSFIVLADIHIENRNAQGFEKLAYVIAANNSNGAYPKIKFVVVLGDITQYGAERDIIRFLDITDGFEIPTFPVIGNHDIFFGNWSVWRNHIGSTKYSIRADSATLIVLDSANSFFGKQQLDWLENELEGITGRVFVFTHNSLFREGTVRMWQTSSTRERKRIISILRNRADIMFMGHSHRRLITEVGNVRYINIEDFRSSRVFCLVTVTPDGVTYTFKNL